MTNQEFINKISKIVIKENQNRKNPLYSSVVIAQAILETGYGKSNIMMKANAVFGIKATSDWNGKVYNANTQECYDNINYTNINACFRAYNKLSDSIKDYFDLICKSSRYKKALNTNSPRECITAIKNGGYATDPIYVDKILNIISSNNLTKYDKKVVENVDNSVEKSYIVGKDYILQVDLNVRNGAGKNYRIKKLKEMTSDGQKNALKNKDNYAILKKGTIVTCQEVIKKSKDIWLKIPSGYIAGYYQGEVYVK